jgi:hypothetical protein
MRLRQASHRCRPLSREAQPKRDTCQPEQRFDTPTPIRARRWCLTVGLLENLAANESRGGLLLPQPARRRLPRRPAAHSGTEPPHQQPVQPECCDPNAAQPRPDPPATRIGQQAREQRDRPNRARDTPNDVERPVSPWRMSIPRSHISSLPQQKTEVHAHPRFSDSLSPIQSSAQAGSRCRMRS